MTLPLAYGALDPNEVNDRLRYGSFVSQKCGLLYVDTPKAACTAIKWLLATIEGHDIPLSVPANESQLEMCIHYREVNSMPSLLDLPDSIVEEVFRDGRYQRFCVVRNPSTRLVSAWSDKVRQVEPGFAETCRSVLSHAGSTAADAVPTFGEFAAWVVQTNDARRCDAHWRTQKSLLWPELIPYTAVLRIEQLAADLQRLFNAGADTRHLNAEQLLGTHEYNVSLPITGPLYDAALAAAVASFYDEDFAAFGYERDSWKTCFSSEAPPAAALEGAALTAIRARNAVIECLSRELAEARART